MPTITRGEPAVKTAVAPGVRAQGTRTPFTTVSKGLGRFSNWMFMVPMLGMLVGKASTVGKKDAVPEDLTGLRSHLHKASGVMKMPDVPLSELPKGEKISNYANRALGNKLGGRLAEKSTSQLAIAASTGIGGTIGIVSGFGGKIKMLQQMQMELTGKMPSRLKIIMGGSELHPMVNQIRKRELLSAQSLAATAFDAGGIAFSLWNMFAKRQPAFMNKTSTQIAIGIGFSGVSSVLTGMNTGVDSYAAARKYAEMGEPIPMETYAGMIGGALKKAKESDVYALAEQCQAKNLTPAQTLQLVNDTFYNNQPVVGAATAREAARRAAATGQQQLAGV